MANREQPIQEYFPSARVRLIIRFEDYGEGDTPKPPAIPPQLRRGTTKQTSKAELEVVEHEGALVLVGPGDNPNAVGSPQEQHASLDGFTHVIDGIIPTSAGLSRNGIRTADTLQLSLKYRDLPIDPRVVRSCAVEYFLGCVTPDDYERGMRGQLRREGVAPNAGVPYNVIPDTYLDAYGRPRTNLRFQGWVDNWEDDWPNSDAPTVALSCTDNTRLLIEQDHPTKMSMAIDVPIDRAIAQYLANFPQFRGLRVEYRPGSDAKPVLKDVLNAQAYPKGVGPSTAKGGDNKLTVWDYITDVVGSIGLTVRMAGVTIIVQRARTLYADKFAGREEDPFQGRVLPSGRALARRLFIYGQNVSSMKAARSFTKYAPQNIEVRCYNPRRKKTLIARYPTFVADRQKRLNPGETADQKFTVIRVTGIGDEETLRVIAQTAYETIGRRELEFQIDTKNLGSFGGGNLDPDVLDAQEGDALDLEVHREADGLEQNSVTMIEQEIRRRPAQFLIELGFPAEFAAAYAKAVSNISFPTTFRLRELDIDWDAEGEGISLSLRVINFVEARADTNLPEGEEVEPDDLAPAPTQVIVQEY